MIALSGLVLGLIGNATAVDAVRMAGQSPFELRSNGNNVLVHVSDNIASNSLDVYHLDGTLVLHRENDIRYTFRLPEHSVYLFSFLDRLNGKSYSRKVSL